MDNLRTFYIFGLLIVSLLLWQAWQKDYVLPRQAQTTQSDTTQTPDLAEAGKGQPRSQDLPDLPVKAMARDIPQNATAINAPHAETVRVKTDVIDAEIDPIGADIHRLKLLAYPVAADKPDTPVQLLADKDKRFFIVQSGLRSDSSAPTHYARFESEKQTYQLPAGQDVLAVPFHWSSESGLSVTKTYYFHRNRYLVDVEYEIRNQSGEVFTAYPYAQFNRIPPEKHSGFVYTYTGAVFSSKDEHYEKVKFDDLDDRPYRKQTQEGWAAMAEHYFVGAIIPKQDKLDKTLYGKAVGDRHFTAGIKMPTVVVRDGEQAKASYSVYLGPKEAPRLEKAAKYLDLTVDYGVFTIISEPLFTVMKWIHKVTGNWGWSIVITVILLKLLFFKLSAASYRSMASMRKLTPKLQMLKERYGDDKQKFNQEMMKLYRTEKINPLGGCLPILVQMPVFLAFYWVLVESIELRQAPFILWIQDLTAMDPYFVLPVLFGLSMFFQQKLNPAPQDPAQAMVMKAFPVIFTVFFAFFPSGLVLYWVVNNVLSIAQQWYITRKLGAL